MFDYIEQDSFLHRRNPVIKLAMIAVITVIVCLSYFPVLPAVTFLVFFFGTWIAGRIPMRNLLRRLLVFLIISILFMISMLLLRGLQINLVLLVNIRLMKRACGFAIIPLTESRMLERYKIFLGERRKTWIRRNF